MSDKAFGAAATAAIEIYARGQQAYAQPRRFADVLDAWGEKLLALGPGERQQLSSHLETLWEGGDSLMESGRAGAWGTEELQERLDALPCPAAAFSARGALLAANDLATEELGLAQGGRLADCAFAAADAGRIETILRDAPAAAAEGRDGGVVALSSIDGAPSLYELTARPALDNDEILLIARGLELRVGARAMDELSRAFALTEAEAAIAHLTAEGMSAAEIAARRRTSVETVRTQIKSLREKTGARSQLELLRLVAGVSSVAEKVDPLRAGAYGMPRRHSLVQLSNGRRIEYVRIGPAEGKPLIVLHAVLFGFRWPRALTEPLVEAGYTLYFPVRPGYGLSSGVAVANDYETEVDDLADFADRLGLESYRIVSQGVSAGVGAALARRHHNRVEGMAAISGYLPIDAEEFFADMTGWQRTVLHVARSAPRLMKFTSRLASRMIRRIGAAEFYAKTFSNSRADTGVTRDAESLALLEASLRLLRAQQLDGLNNDFPRVVIDWTETWEALRTPTLQIHGGQKQVFHPERAAAVCARHDAVDFALIEDGGQMLAYSHPEKVASLLIRHFGVAAAR